MIAGAIVLGSLTVALAIMIHAHLVTKEIRMAVPQNIQDFIAGIGPAVQAYAVAYAAQQNTAATAAATAAEDQLTEVEAEAAQDNTDTLAALQQGLTAATTLPPAAPAAPATGAAPGS